MADFFQLPKVSFGEGDLEPVFSGEMFDIHYNKHHRGYLNKLNQLLEKYQEAERKKNLEEMLALIPLIQFNGGGFLNHSFFWESLTPKALGGGILLEGELKDEIDKQFGSLKNLVSQLTALSLGISGSGWGWLCWSSAFERFELVTTQNHDHPAIHGLVPLLTIDVWEHAYYLRYKNLRLSYLETIWEIINWKKVVERFREAVYKSIVSR